MALVDNAWYVNYGDGSAGAGKKSWFDVTAWATGTVTAAGALVRQLAAPAVGSERVFVCVVAGTTHAATEPTWTTTRGATTTDNTVTWQECTGIAAINGDATNTPSWTISATPPGGVKNTAVTKGQVIKRDNGASYQICTTAGTAGNGAEPGFSDTAGTTTADNTVTWTSLGVVGNFTGWQAPHARLNNAFTANWGRAGNMFFIGDNHAETVAATLTLTSPGTTGSPCFIYDVDRSVAVPPGSGDLKTTASISATGAVSHAHNGVAYYNGIIFNGGSGATSANITIAANNYTKYENCSIRKLGTVANGAAILIGIKAVLVNTTLQFASTGDGIKLANGIFVWENTPSALIGTIPNVLFPVATSSAGIALLRGIDLSAITVGPIVSTTNGNGNTTLIDCKVTGSVVLSAAITQRSEQVHDFIRVDSAGTNYRTERYLYTGSQAIETTIIRTGGASDGTTPISWKIVSTANSLWVDPFESIPIAIWNTSTSAITTLTIYGTTTGGGVPNNDDIWVEVEYLGSGASPLGSFITTTKANNLAASASTNNSSDASTWGGGGAGNGFKIVVPSFTPAQAGPINIVVKVAKVSATYYIDPRPSISGVTVSKSEILAPGVYANELSSGSAGGGSRSRIQTGH